MKKKFIESFSLVEVIVFIAILGVFFVSAASIATVSLRNMKVNEHKIMATYYAEDLLSWLRSKKDESWDSVKSKAGTSGTYCFDKYPINAVWPSSGACGVTSYDLSSLYKRQAILVYNLTKDQIEVGILVSWNELGKDYSVPLNTIFKSWE